MEPKLLVKRLKAEATLPVRKSALAAGYDLASAEECVVPSHGVSVVHTGLAIHVPVGHYGRVAPRSSLAVTNSIDVGAGVIDGDYRGEVGVVLFNHSSSDFAVHVGDRIAQLIIERISTPEVIDASDLSDTARGAGGFGSTGLQ